MIRNSGQRKLGSPAGWFTLASLRREGGWIRAEYDSDRPCSLVPGRVPVQASGTSEERGLRPLASVRRTGAGFVWLWLAVALTGCATRQPASPFIIRSGHGPLEAGRFASSKLDRRKIEDASRQALAERAATRARVPLSIEGADPLLRDALAAVGRRESPDSHIAVAMNYWRLRVYDAAFDHYSEALRLDPKNATALDGRARVWRHWGMTEP